MATPGERRALLFIASIAALGVAVRGWMEFRPKDSQSLAGDRAALARQIEAVDSAIATTSSARKPRPPRAAPPRDESAPRSNPAPRAPAASRPSRSRAIPAPPDTQPRDPRQAYWDRSLYFDSVRAALDAEGSPPPAQSRRLRAQSPSSAIRHLSSSKASPPSAIRRLSSAAPQAPLDLDLASIDEAAALPFIGAGLARRIVLDRIENGPFGSLAGLERVQGLSPALARRLAPFVTFSGSPRLGSAGERRNRQKNEPWQGGASRP